jgi:hypothetical protein
VLGGTAQRRTPRVIWKLDLTVIAVVIAGGLLRVEYGHRVVIEPPTSTELTWREAAAACPTNDNMPYGTDCLAYLKGAADTGMRRQISAADSKPVALSYAPSRNELTALATVTPCPDSDNVPYTASCVKFLSGWLWRANAAESPAARQYTP